MLMLHSQRFWLMLHVLPDIDDVGANLGLAAWIRHINPACEVSLFSADRMRDNLVVRANACDLKLYTQFDAAMAPYAAGVVTM
jgi:hypothetical protein